MDVAVVDRQLADALRARGQRVTPQRLVIHRVLRRENRHFAADELLEAVGAELPNVSLPTIYGTLELFAELGIVRPVAAHGRVLYDSRPGPHAHALCRRCGRLEDVDAPVDARAALAAAGRSGFAGERAELTVHGVCAACAAA